MIISASRRTDIPAFYGNWFIRRYKSGIFYIKNPFNASQVKIIDFRNEHIKCIVFWTKNAKPFIDSLKEIHTPFYFLYTITNYGKIFEPFVPEIKDTIKTFKNLSSLVGPDRVVWRYDPIIFTSYFDEKWHLKNFEFLCKNLSKYTEKCIVSFLYMYKKCWKNLKSFEIENKSEEKVKLMIKLLEEIAYNNGIEINWCCVDNNYLNNNSIIASCINIKIIEKLSGFRLLKLKDKNQRKECNCYPSIDIGTYNTCVHGCKYCYANKSFEIALLNFKKHNPESLFIV